MNPSSFQDWAEYALKVQVSFPVNRLGGYGPGGEVIYCAHPTACPSTLVDHQGPATATFLSNGSLCFEIKLQEGLEVQVLQGSFDPVEKRETGVLSANCWLELEHPGGKQIASLINPRMHWNLPAESIKIIKTGAPQRSMGYCSSFSLAGGGQAQAVVRLRLARQPGGVALLREIYLRNPGQQPLAGNLWTCFHLPGTQRFVYHKSLWYDAGLTLSPLETVVCARVPQEDILQIKRISSQVWNCHAVEATCDYTAFVGDSGDLAIFPEAIRRGSLIHPGVCSALNRFSTPTLAGNRFSFSLDSQQSACLVQSLLYITDPDLIQRFRERTATSVPGFAVIQQAFRSAAEELVQLTPPAEDLPMPPVGSKPHPPFALKLPADPVTAHYLNSLWTGVDELYEKCRAHGARLADGIELGTRDRAQDMWPKMKTDPALVRADLLHALGFMYVTGNGFPTRGQRLSLREKLHGMFPRQFPSRWLDRSKPVYNDNRPYADSALWLLETLHRYLLETGDRMILLEEVPSVRLIDPDHPETSGIVAAETRFKVIEVVAEVFASYSRHVQDSPYHLAQVLFGDWCDPVDMFGTSMVGISSTRGQGRGAQVRLSAHLFLCLVSMIDLIDTPSIQTCLAGAGIYPNTSYWKEIAGLLRQSILLWGWQEEPNGQTAGFIDCLHEFRLDGTTPDYASGECGYTLGSLRGTDFDGVDRRLLTTQAYGLEMLRLERDYLDPLPDRPGKIQKVLASVDALFFKPQLGLVLFSTPVANNLQALRLVGRLGVVPPGCAENGEYHHAQMFMHRYRLNIPGEAQKVWEQFKPVLSVNRDEGIGGPFEITSNSFAADPDDPHYGKGMYFGLSGSVDWMVEILQKVAGLELDLQDDRKPDLTVRPCLPPALGSSMTYQRILFKALPGGGHKSIPLTLLILPLPSGGTPQTRINGQPVPEPLVWDLLQYDRLEISIEI